MYITHNCSAMHLFVAPSIHRARRRRRREVGPPNGGAGRTRREPKAKQRVHKPSRGCIASIGHESYPLFIRSSIFPPSFARPFAPLPHTTTTAPRTASFYFVKMPKEGTGSVLRFSSSNVSNTDTVCLIRNQDEDNTKGR